MTVAVVVKVYDGMALATDSATTLGGVGQVWNSANKLFHLHRQYPVAAMTWGMGSIGPASIATLAKDLRRRFMGRDPTHPDWELGPGYTMEQVTDRLVDMMFGELYSKVVTKTKGGDATLGMFVGGFSDGLASAEGRVVIFEDPAVRPTPHVFVDVDGVGWGAFATPWPAHRLVSGIDPALQDAVVPLLQPGMEQDFDNLVESFRRPIVHPAMPFGDAIALARYLAQVTAGYSRFWLGIDTVGGPIDIAGITRYEGFKWIERKHYYPAHLNPEDPHHDF